MRLLALPVRPFPEPIGTTRRRLDAQVASGSADALPPVQAFDSGTTTNSSWSACSGCGFSLHQAAAPVASTTRARKR